MRSLSAVIFTALTQHRYRIRHRIGIQDQANHIWDAWHLQLQPAVRRSIVIFHCPSSGFGTNRRLQAQLEIQRFAKPVKLAASPPRRISFDPMADSVPMLG